MKEISLQHRDTFSKGDIKPLLPVTNSDVPSAASEKSASQLSSLLSCVMYTGCSISMVLANKAIPTTVPMEYHSSLPQTSIILFQCVVAVLFCEIARVMNLIDYPGLSWPIMKQWLPVNLFFISMLFTGFLSLVHASVPMVTIFKNVTNLFTVFGDWYLFGEPVGVLTIVSILIMTLGAILAGLNDLEFTFYGYMWMILNCLSTSGYVLYMRYASTNIKLTKFGMVYYNNILSSIILLPFVFLRGELEIMYNPIFAKPSFLIANAVAGFLGFYLNFASLWCVSATSATTYSILGAINKVPITILGFLLFDAKLTNEGILFVAFATFGGFLYAYSKLPNQIASK